MLFFLILIISGILQIFLPWYIIGIVAYLSAFLKGRNAKESFFSGFFSIFVLWLIVSLAQTIPNGNILANRIGKMLMLPDSSFNWFFVLLLTCLLGGIVGGISSLAGFYLKRLIKRDHSSKS